MRDFETEMSTIYNRLIFGSYNSWGECILKNRTIQDRSYSRMMGGGGVTPRGKEFFLISKAILVMEVFFVNLSVNKRHLATALGPSPNLRSKMKLWPSLTINVLRIKTMYCMFEKRVF